MSETFATLPATGEKVAVDKISTVDYQLVKWLLGAIDTNDGPVGKTNPLPAVIWYRTATRPTPINASDSSQLLVAEDLTAPRRVWIYNKSTASVWIGLGGSAVTVATSSTRIPPDQTVVTETGAAIYGIGDTGSTGSGTYNITVEKMA